MPDSDNSNPPIRTVFLNRRPMRRLFYAAIVIGFAVISCAGCCVLMAIFLGLKSTDRPQEVEEVAAHIIDWSIPAGFEGKAGMTFDNAAARIDAVKFEHHSGRGILIACQWKAKAEMFKFPNQVEKTKEFIDGISPELKKLDLDQKVLQTLEILGHPAEFELGKGEDRASTTRFRQVTGTFQGKLAEAVLILQCEEGLLSDEEIDVFLKSLK